MIKKLLLIAIVLLVSISEVAFAGASQKSQDIAATRAKELFIAVANGNVTKIKALTTPEFYKEKFPYSDSKVRSELLSVPLAKRQQMINQIKNETEVSTLPNTAGDVITVFLSNKVTKKQFVVQLICEEGDDNWLVFNYEY